MKKLIAQIKEEWACLPYRIKFVMLKCKIFYLQNKRKLRYFHIVNENESLKTVPRWIYKEVRYTCECIPVQLNLFRLRFVLVLLQSQQAALEMIRYFRR